MAINSFEDISNKWHFNVLTTAYKALTSKKGTVQPIKVDVWIPSQPPKSPDGYPVILFLHGGGLFTANRAFAPYINGWFPGFAEQHNAVVVSPDYRLIPESTGQDIIDDLEDFFQWTIKSSDAATTAAGEVSPSLRSFLQTSKHHVKIDLHHIMATGGSAGSYCATHLALSHSNPSKGPYIRSLLLQYPFVDVDCTWTHDGNPEYNKASKNPATRIFGREPSPLEEFQAFDESARKMRAAGEIVTESSVFERTAVFSCQYYGRWGQWILEGQQPQDEAGPRDVVVFRRISKGRDVTFPARTVIIHGTSDSAVPVQTTPDLVKLLNARFPESEVHVQIFDGLEHGFDGEDDIVNSPRIQNDLAWAAEPWLL